MEYEEFKRLNMKYSGSMSREPFIKSHYNEFYQKINDFRYDNNLQVIGFKELINRYFKNDLSPKKCLCGKNLKFYSIEKGFSQFCSVKCSNSNTVEKIRAIKKEKYGDSNYNNREQFKQSIKERTKKDKDLSLEKRRNTKNKKYGDPNFTNRDLSSETRKKTNIESINKKLKDYGVKVIDVLVNSAYLIECEKCNTQSKILNSRINSRLRKGIDPCIKCHNHNDGTSVPENDLYEYVSSLGYITEKNNRKILNGSEIDVLIPELNIGFEFNGLFWHSEMNVDSEYHMRKQNMALDKGIKLINIWEDDWENKKDIIKSKIKHILKIKGSTIYARKCDLRVVDYKKTKDFLETNHLQGFCPYKNSIGLWYKNELISICTFGSRKISGESKTELLRFANKLNHHIPGGFTKILNYYIKNFNPVELITFSDRCWSPEIENVYLLNGFEHMKTTKPNYFYIVDKIRIHRYNYRKDILVKMGYDKNLTEREIMLDLGINRIYDCGQNKYKLVF
jgi:hypothetical protein